MDEPGGQHPKSWKDVRYARPLGATIEDGDKNYGGSLRACGFHFDFIELDNQGSVLFDTSKLSGNNPSAEG